MLPGAKGDPELFGGLELPVVKDHGPQSVMHAKGTATLDDQGTPVVYTVAPDDNIESIALRFCLQAAYLEYINSVRRSGDALYIGDTINLDAHTVFSVGDQNGVVHQNPPPPFTLPPQH